MSEATQRLIPACFVALILHGVALCWQIHGQTTLPTPFAAQRIAVSLGARPVARESPPEPKQEYKPEKKKKDTKKTEEAKDDKIDEVDASDEDLSEIEEDSTEDSPEVDETEDDDLRIYGEQET